MQWIFHLWLCMLGNFFKYDLSVPRKSWYTTLVNVKYKVGCKKCWKSSQYTSFVPFSSDIYWMWAKWLQYMAKLSLKCCRSCQTTCSCREGEKLPINTAQLSHIFTTHRPRSIHVMCQSAFYSVAVKHHLEKTKQKKTKQPQESWLTLKLIFL